MAFIDWLVGHVAYHMSEPDTSDVDIISGFDGHMLGLPKPDMK